jgi:outer membrane protein OmpA-like peptidoglycan-associated protein
MAYINGGVSVPALAGMSHFGEPIVIAPPVTVTRLKTVLALPGFKFADNKLQPEHVTAIKDFAKVVAADKTAGRVLRFVGHTDSAGPPKVNLRLGFGRAQIVLMRMTDELEALGEFGVKTVLETTGAAIRLGDNRTAEGRATNRGVAIVFERPAPPCGPRGGGGLRGFGEPPVTSRVPDTRPNRPEDLNIDRFEFKLSLVPPVHRAAIDALADRIVAVARRVTGPIGRVELFGHADFIGERGYNNPLGLMRAKAVRGALATALDARLRGVTSRIEIVPFSLGEDYPVDPSNRSDEGRARSRRVQVYVALVPVPPPVPKPVPDLDPRKQIKEDPGGRKGPPWRPPSQGEDARKRWPEPPPPPKPKCVRPYEKVVAFLRRLLDKALGESHIPPKYHKKIKQLAEQRAVDQRNDLIDRGLDEIGLQGQLKVAARELVIYAIKKACFYF